MSLIFLYISENRIVCLFISYKLAFLPNIFFSIVSITPTTEMVIHGKMNYLDHVKRFLGENKVLACMIGVQVHGSLLRVIELAFNL